MEVFFGGGATCYVEYSGVYLEVQHLDNGDSASLTAWAYDYAEHDAPTVDLVAHMAAVAPARPAVQRNTQVWGASED